MMRELKQLQRENAILRNIVSYTLPIARDHVNGKSQGVCNNVNVFIQEAIYLRLVIAPNEFMGLYSTPSKEYK